nr:response regulator transcription factor [Pontibaca salina]
MTNVKKTQRGVFIGNSLDFSNTILRFAAAEFDCIDFIRIAAFDDLFGDMPESDAQCRMIIISESLAEELQNNITVLQEKFTQAQFVLAYRNPEIARDFILQGQHGTALAKISFLPMTLEIDRWMAILRLLVCGEKYVPYELFDSPASAGPDAAPEARRNTVPPASKLAKLTERELQVLSSVSEGKQNKIIAAELALSEHTVKLHIHNMIAKLGVNNRTEAAICYLADQSGADGPPR